MTFRPNLNEIREYLEEEFSDPDVLEYGVGCRDVAARLDLWLEIGGTWQSVNDTWLAKNR